MLRELNPNNVLFRPAFCTLFQGNRQAFFHLLPSSEKYTYISSSVVKEMAKYGADLKELIPREILEDVIERAGRR